MSIEKREMAPRKSCAEKILKHFKFKTEKFRFGLAMLCCMVFVYMVVDVLIMYFFNSGSHNDLGDAEFNEFFKAAAEIRIDQSKTIFQFVVIFMSALAGLLVAKKSEAVLVLADRPEIIMSVMATLLLVSSFICHLQYMSDITDLYMSASGANTNGELNMPNFFEPGVSYLFVAQYRFLIAGTLNTFLTFLSAHLLK